MLEDDDAKMAAAVETLMPVDLYLEKTALSILPPGTKLRNPLGSVCRMRGYSVSSVCVCGFLSRLDKLIPGAAHQ